MFESDLHSRCESLLAEFERKRFDAQLSKNRCDEAEAEYLAYAFEEAAMDYVVTRLRFVLNDQRPPVADLPF